MRRDDLIQQLAQVATHLPPVLPPASSLEQVSALCTTARLAFGAAAVSVAALRDTTLHYLAAAGEGAAEVVGMDLPVSRGLAGYVAMTGQMLAVDSAADDPRFADAAALQQNVGAATDIFRNTFAERTAAEWREALASFSGQWVCAQDTLEAALDVQVQANGMIQELTAADGTPFKLVAAPVQYDGAAATPSRAPGFNEHGDAILESLGLDWDTVVDLKVRGAVA